MPTLICPDIDPTQFKYIPQKDRWFDKEGLPAEVRVALLYEQFKVDWRTHIYFRDKNSSNLHPSNLLIINQHPVEMVNGYNWRVQRIFNTYTGRYSTWDLYTSQMLIPDLYTRPITSHKLTLEKQVKLLADVSLKLYNQEAPKLYTLNVLWHHMLNFAPDTYFEDIPLAPIWYLPPKDTPLVVPLCVADLNIGRAWKHSDLEPWIYPIMDYL